MALTKMTKFKNKIFIEIILILFIQVCYGNQMTVTDEGIVMNQVITLDLQIKTVLSFDLPISDKAKGNKRC